LADVTGLAIITVDYKGVPVTRHSNRRDFCGYIREKPELNVFCQKCDSRGGLEAVRIGQPYMYFCHCKIVDIAIPIIVDDKYIGAIMAGEIRFKDKNEENALETILNSPSQLKFDSPVLKKYYAEIPFMQLSKLKTSVNLLNELSNYIVEEALNKNILLELCGHDLNGNNNTSLSGGYSTGSVETLLKDINDVVIDSYIKTNANNDFILNNKSLKLAFDFIHQNKKEMVTQKQAASLCHLSSGHFSRLFLKETGVSYTNYYSRLKIEWSKDLLVMTDFSISQISEELGFSDPGYYIKTFRKYEGLTPLTYRKEGVR